MEIYFYYVCLGILIMEVSCVELVLMLENYELCMFGHARWKISIICSFDQENQDYVMYSFTYKHVMASRLI
jgi:hypothetical protein